MPLSTAKPNRMLHLDLLRGIFLCVIIIDHLQFFPGFFDIFTGRGYLWASAAEGFFFLSGILLGLVRGRRELVLPFREVVRKLWIRAGRLYLWNVLLTLIFTALAFFFAGSAGVKPGLITSTNVQAILKEAFTLQYTYGWADFLQYYAIFLFVSPLVIWLLRRGYWWLVVFLSIGTWYVGGSSFYLSWQLLFFFGAIFGFYVDEIHTMFKGLKTRTQHTLVGITAGLAVISFVVSYITILGSSYVRNRPGSGLSRLLPLDRLEAFNHFVSAGFDKTSLGVGRIIIFFVWFFTLYFLVKRFEPYRQLGRFGRGLIRFGQNSLYVYIMHSFVLFFLNLALPHGNNIIVNASIDCGVIFFIYVCLHRRWLFRIIPR